MESNDSSMVSSEAGDYFYEDIDTLREPWVREPHFVPLVLVYGLVFLLGIVGNGVVIFCVIWNPSFRNTTFYFLVSLAIADILFLLIVIPHETLRMVLGDWSGGRAYCKISGFTEMLTAVSSILNLTALSFERYFVIALPIQSRRRCTTGNTRRVLIAVWVVALVLASPALYVKDTESTTYFNNVTSVTLIFCSDHGLRDHERIYFAIYQLLVMFVIPTVLMGYCYTVVIYVLWISRKTLVRLTASPRARSNPRHTNACIPDTRASLKGYHPRKFTSTGNDVSTKSIIKGRKQVIKMLMLVVITFLFCWGPKLVFQLFKYSDYRSSIHFTAFFKLQIAIYCLPYIQSCLNPVIYSFMSENFRKGVVTSCQHSIGPIRYRQSHVEIAGYEMESKLNNGAHTTRTPRCSTDSSQQGLEVNMTSVVNVASDVNSTPTGGTCTF